MRIAGDVKLSSCNISSASIGSISLDGIDDLLLAGGDNVLKGDALCNVFLDKEETSDDLLSRPTTRRL